MNRRRWVTALFVLGLVAFAVGMLIAVVDADIVKLAVGLFGTSRPWAAACLLAAAAAAMGIVAWSRRDAEGRGTPVPRLIGIVSLVAVVAVLVTGRPPYRTRTVSYQSGSTTLVATLYSPPDTGPHPTVILVHGSAPFKRAFYHPWADRIARTGFAVLVADKRGVGESGGHFERNDNASHANLWLLASDVSAAADYLLMRSDIDRDRIGLVGLSQAGWVAPKAALATPHIRYLALITAPAVSTREEGAWSRLRGDDETSALVSQAAAEAILDTVAPRGVDTRHTLGKLAVPSLWLFGSDDNSIPTAKSVRVLDSLAAAGRPIERHILDGYGHVLMGRPNGRLVPEIAPASWAILLRWLDSVGRTGETGGRAGA